MLRSLNRLSPDPCTDREEAEQTPLGAEAAFIHLQNILFRAGIQPVVLQTTCPELVGGGAGGGLIQAASQVPVPPFSASFFLSVWNADTRIWASNLL